jgi:hypothetical protein
MGDGAEADFIRDSPDDSQSSVDFVLFRHFWQDQAGGVDGYRHPERLGRRSLG